MKVIKEKDTLAITRDEEKYQREADRWLEMFSIFIHDIESPLASMKYILKLIDEGKLDLKKERHQRLVSSSAIALERAESIIYDIMSVAKAGKVGLPVSLTTIVPDAIIREAILLVSASAEERGIKVSYANKTGDTAVKADPKLLKRAIDNLLYNAVRHTPSGGTIAVYTDMGEESWFVHIKDSGPGLDDVDPEKLFEKYGQMELRADGKHRGVGLGLYFCKLAATGMGGTIIADDHPEGGAVFSIRLLKYQE